VQPQKNKFKRIAIQEDSDEEDEPKIEDVTDKANKTPEPAPKEPKVLKPTLVSEREAKELMRKGGIEFEKKFTEMEREEQLAEENERIRQEALKKREEQDAMKKLAQEDMKKRQEEEALLREKRL